MKPEDERFVAEICRELGRWSEDIDPVVRRRLTQARMRALRSASIHEPKASSWIPLATAAAALLLMVVGAVWLATPSMLELEHEALLELAAGDPDLELVEDLEFYEWLAVQPEQPTEPGAANGA